MKRRPVLIAVITIGVLAFIFILLVPAAPLFFRLGIEPVCIQGDFPNLRVVSCQQVLEPTSQSTPLPLPTLAGASPTPLIFDDDGSPDGMLALLFFLKHPNYDVRAVTISSGEAHPRLFTPLVRRFLAALGRPDIPVGAGRETPLQGGNAFPAPWRQSSDDFWEISLPESKAVSDAQPSGASLAARLIIETIGSSSQPVALFISGTHTNLAEALRLDPTIKQQILAVYVMGGSVYQPGNIKSAWPEINNETAEWNIWVDPLAASEVFNSGIPIHLMPLDGTNQVTWSQLDADEWAAAEQPTGRMAARLLDWRLNNWPTEFAYIWDLAAAVGTTDPRLCPPVPLHLEIETEEGADQGQTRVSDGAPNVQVCLEPDAWQVKARVADLLSR